LTRLNKVREADVSQRKGKQRAGRTGFEPVTPWLNDRGTGFRLSIFISEHQAFPGGN
jgi:hypothetical protein